jgi:hypothetical protein
LQNPGARACRGNDFLFRYRVTSKADILRKALAAMVNMVR